MDKGLLRSLVRSLVVALAGHCVLTSSSAGTVFFDDFDDGAEEGFEEVGGAWSVVDGNYVQTTTNPPGPYRSWVNALQEYGVDVDFTLLSGQEAKVIYAYGDAGEDYRVDFATIASSRHPRALMRAATNLGCRGRLTSMGTTASSSAASRRPWTWGPMSTAPSASRL